MSNRYSKPLEKQLATKRLAQFMKKLCESLVLVEGDRDKRALAMLGCENLFTVSGKTRSACEKAAATGAGHAIILTDIDDRGNELALEVREELGRYGVKCDIELRKTIAGLLGIRFFEDMAQAYEKFMKEMAE
ncbi:TPA: toprim domain-containing protein [Candidatus Micrarchaeota archaeon]|nr:toprim domain-containing protein [Candidatus Micrarchaeota archaeon]